jgi:MFS family permease
MKEGEFSKSEVKELKHKARRLSIKEGMVWSVRNSFGDKYISPFTIALGTSSPLVAFINSLWNLGPLFQLFAPRFMKKNSRKKIFVVSTFIEAFAWIFMILAGIMYLKGFLIEFIPLTIIIGLLLLLLMAGPRYPAWFSWMGDVVDAKYRGRWWSKRTTIISFTTVVLSITAALFLIEFQKRQIEIIGFIILFIISFITRIQCARIGKKIYEPKYKEKKNNSLKKFIKEIKRTNFSKFVIFRAIFAMTIGLTSPLVSIYLLRDLNLDYLTYIILMLAGTFFSVITLNLWGKIADTYGNYRVIALTTILIPITPLLWILSENTFYLFLVPALIGGTAWTAFLMASGNFIYDNVKKEKIGNAVSYFYSLVAIGAFLGGIIASILLKNLDTNWIKPLYLIFIIGTIARIIVVSIFVPSLNEVKKKKKFKNLRDLEKEIEKEVKPTIKEDMHQIMEIRQYLREK